MEISFKFLPTIGIRLHTALAGPENGQPVFLLHGFPDAWFGWEAQISTLAEAGFRVIAPDQRGYNLSDKPKGAENYRMGILADDILGLADALGYEQFYLAGHDFGAMVSWRLAMRNPTRVRRMVIANVPHPVVFNRYLRTHFSQMLKSWYILFFQLPGLPEQMAKLFNWRFLISAMPDDLSKETRDRYRHAWAQPEAMTGMINWYRATMLRTGGKAGRLPKIQPATLILWGKQDRFISHEMAQLSVDLCEDGKLILFEEASHWVLHDEPEETGLYMVEHFSQR